MIEMTAHAEGVIIAVRAQPRAKRNGFAGVCNRRMKLSVTAPADKGRANEALHEVLAEALGVKKGQVELVSGSASREKKFLIRGLGNAEIERRLANLLAANDD